MWRPDPESIYRVVGGVPRAYELSVSAYSLGQIADWRRRAIAELGLKQGDRVLDLACGTGLNLPFLEERVRASGTIVAVDLSPEMLAIARRSAEAADWRNIDFRETSATHPRLRAASVEGALCTLGLSVIPDHAGAVAAVRRALKPGGRFAVLDVGQYQGIARVLNPAHRLTNRYLAGADVDKDFLGPLRAEFGTVAVERFHGAAFIAVTQR